MVHHIRRLGAQDRLLIRFRYQPCALMYKAGHCHCILIQELLERLVSRVCKQGFPIGFPQVGVFWAMEHHVLLLLLLLHGFYVCGRANY